MDPITIDELLIEFRRLGVESGDGEGLTARELEKKWGLGRVVVKKRLRQAREAGMLRVSQKRGTRIDGQSCLVPSYVIELPDRKAVQNK